jgi:hypothetical protein
LANITPEITNLLQEFIQEKFSLLRETHEEEIADFVKGIQKFIHRELKK